MTLITATTSFKHEQTEELTPPAPTNPPKSDSFIALAVAIVKQVVQNPDQLTTQLSDLAATSSEEQIQACLPELIRQVQETLKSTDLHTIYDRMIQDLNLFGLHSQTDFSSYPEEFRFACAKRLAAREPRELCRNIQKFGIKNQNYLVQLAKICAEDDTRNYFDRYDLAEQGMISIYIDNFGIESEEGRIAIAKIAAKNDAEFSLLLLNYKITNKDALKEIAAIALKNGDDTFFQNVDKYAVSMQHDILPLLEDWEISPDMNLKGIFEDVFKIDDTSLRNKILNNLFKNPEHITFVCENIQRLIPREQQDKLFECAQLIAMHDGQALLDSFHRFPLTSQENRFNIARMLLESSGSTLNLDNLKSFLLNFHDRALLYSRFIEKHADRTGESVHFFPTEIGSQALLLGTPDLNTLVTDQNVLLENGSRMIEQFESSGSLVDFTQCNMHFESRKELYYKFAKKYPEFAHETSHFFTQDETSLLFPERLLSNPNSDFDVEKYLADLSKYEKDLTPHIESLSKKPVEDANLMALRCSVLTFAKDSPELMSKLMSILDELKGKKEFVRNNTLLWMARFIEKTRFKNIQDILNKPAHFALFKALLNLPDTQVREMLTPYFIDELSHPRLDRSSVVQRKSTSSKKIGDLNAKDMANVFASLVIGSLLSKIEPYMDGVKFTSNKDGTVVGERQMVSFSERMKQLLTNDYFKNSQKMSKLIKNLMTLIETDKLTDDQKSTILKDLIFAKDPNLNVKQQSEQIFRSCQNVALMVDKNPELLTELLTPKELETAVLEQFRSEFQIEGDFADQFATTFGMMSRPGALLVYGNGLKKDPHIPYEKTLQPLLSKCARWILDGTFVKNRYSLKENPSEHLEKLAQHPEVLENWARGATYDCGDYEVTIRPNPEDLILIGQGTCQAVDGSTFTNKCLGSYILDPKNCPAIIRRKGSSEILARCMTRLLFDDSGNPVLFQEAYYWRDPSKDYEKMLTDACIEHAKSLKKDGGIPLMKKKAKVDNPGGPTVTAYPGPWLYEMVDALESIGVTDGYKIPHCTCLYEPKPKEQPPAIKSLPMVPPASRAEILAAHFPDMREFTRRGLPLPLPPARFLF